MSHGEAYVEAYVSLATNDSYAMGALVLAKSIRDTGSSKRLALMVSTGISGEMRERLSKVWDELIDIELLDSGDAEHLALLARPELGVTFSKINAWRLCQYAKCVFLDADTLILQNVDELFDREELSAAPDIGWPDCFNSGVFVFEPSLQTFHELVELATHTGSFDGGDQGLLNLYWRDWATKDIKYHLPFTFNVTPNVTYGYAPAFQRFGRDVKIIHFIGPIKPWQHRYLKDIDAIILYPGTYASQNAAQDYIRRWWQVYTSLEQQPTSDPDTHTTSDSSASNSSPFYVHHLSPRYRSPHRRPAQSRSHSPSSSYPVFVTPNLGSSTDTSRNPYHHILGAPGSSFASHSVSPLDSPSQVIDPMYGPGGFVSKYMKSLSPLSSTYHLPSPDSGTSSPGHRSGASPSPRGGGESSLTPRGLLSPISHEDVHSHISLSFYGADNIFDKVSSAVDKEPRKYYIDGAESCDFEQAAQDDIYKPRSCISIGGSSDGGSWSVDDDLGSSLSASNWSLNHFNPPSFHTPASLLNPLPAITLTPTVSHDQDNFVDIPVPLTWVSTECDEGSGMHVLSRDSHVISSVVPPTSCSGGSDVEEVDDESHDCHVTMAASATSSVPSEGNEVEEDGDTTVLAPDLVLTNAHTSSPPFPPSPPLPPSFPHDPPPTPFQSYDPKKLEPQESMSSSAESYHRKEFEGGMIDIKGRDSSDNLMAFIDSQIEKDNVEDSKETN